MRETKFYCDHCGKELTNNDYCYIGGEIGTSDYCTCGAKMIEECDG